MISNIPTSYKKLVDNYNYVYEVRTLEKDCFHCKIVLNTIPTSDEIIIMLANRRFHVTTTDNIIKEHFVAVIYTKQIGV